MRLSVCPCVCLSGSLYLPFLCESFGLFRFASEPVIDLRFVRLSVCMVLVDNVAYLVRGDVLDQLGRLALRGSMYGPCPDWLAHFRF